MTADFEFPPRLTREPAIPPLEERLTPQQAAELVGVSVHTLRNWRSHWLLELDAESRAWYLGGRSTFVGLPLP